MFIVVLIFDYEVVRYVFKYGDGVKVLVLWVDDVEEVYCIVVECGVKFFVVF